MAVRFNCPIYTYEFILDAAGVDLELPPTQLIIFGKPEGGTLLMQAKRTVAIDLPQKMLVWEENGKTKIAFNDPTWMLDRHGAEVPPEMPPEPEPMEPPVDEEKLKEEQYRKDLLDAEEKEQLKALGYVH